ncbi:MAG: hypothetical protein RBU23_12790 [Candidatus Auribacterota bacterium]|jgi:hypothetical protein|nr:hypothetical protein [Candidatus Auribacterota bacterium]
MNDEINKVMQSHSIVQAANRLHLRKDEIWSIWFDSGLEYLECLKVRVRHKRVFDAMFGALRVASPVFGGLHLPEVFDRIRNSDEFWAWWSTQMWCICREKGTIRDSTELFYRLQFTDSLIPLFILKKIFNGKQEPSGRQTTGSAPACEIADAYFKAGGAGKRIKSRV